MELYKSKFFIYKQVPYTVIGATYLNQYMKSLLKKTTHAILVFKF